MARILYAVCGIGMGHCMRSVPIITELRKEHDVMVVSYGGSYGYLKGKFPETREVKYFEIFMDGATISRGRTVIYNIPKIPHVFMQNLSKYFRILREFNPEIVVSDLEIGAFYFSRLFGIPSIVISNMHAMKFLKLPGEKRGADYYLTEKPTMDAFNGAGNYMIFSLIKPEKKPRNVSFFYPIIGDEISGRKTSDKGFILVYSSSASMLKEAIEPALREIPKQKFRVYCGVKERSVKGNIEFMPFEKDGFGKSLAECSAVINSGGFTLISEAAVLGKPVLSVTPKKVYERYFNGLMLRELGIGEVVEGASAESLNRFIGNLGKYRKNLRKAGIKPDNKEAISIIGEIIGKETTE